MIRKNKRGLSEVVGTVLIIGLTVAAGAIVWAVVNSLITDNLNEGQACFGVFDQVKLNNDYTCYNSSSNNLQFSIKVGDINITQIVVSVSFGGASESATLKNTTESL